MRTAPILVGVPAYQGQATIAETLTSILSQKFSDYRVVISVDGHDPVTAVACEDFLTDRRFSLVLQPTRLGWAGNLNWLMNLNEYDFFCFWQQDDLASADYLSSLYESIMADRTAVCCYSDIQWMGLADHYDAAASVQGPVVKRVWSVIESLNGVPFRGVIRKQAIQGAGPIRLTPFESAFEEFIWVARLAAQGCLRRVPGPIYFKRKHEESTHDKWHRWPPSRRREVWLEFGLGALEVLRPHLKQDDFPSAVWMALKRLCTAKSGRVLLYDPSDEMTAFTVDFLAAAAIRFGLSTFELLSNRSSVLGAISSKPLARS